MIPCLAILFVLVKALIALSFNINQISFIFSNYVILQLAKIHISAAGWHKTSTICSLKDYFRASCFSITVLCSAFSRKCQKQKLFILLILLPVSSYLIGQSRTLGRLLFLSTFSLLFYLFFREQECYRCLVINPWHQNVIQYKESE